MLVLDFLVSLELFGFEELDLFLEGLVFLENVGVAFLLDLFFFGFGFRETLFLALLFYLLRLLVEL